MAISRSFGWHLPSNMMVPLADFLNHLPESDSHYEIFIKGKNFVGVSVDSKDEPVNSRLNYADLDPSIKANPVDSDFTLDLKFC